MSKWLSEGLNWAESVLESVDQKAGETIEKVKEEVVLKGKDKVGLSASGSETDLVEKSYIKQSNSASEGLEALERARSFLADDSASDKDDEDVPVASTQGKTESGSLGGDIVQEDGPVEVMSPKRSAPSTHVSSPVLKESKPLPGDSEDVALLKGELNSLNQEFSDLTSKLRKAKDKLEYTQQVLKETERNKSELERQFDERVDAVLKEKRALEEQYSTAFIAKDQKVSRLQDEVNDHEKLLSDANAHIAEQDTAIEKLEGELSSLKSDHRDALEELGKLQMTGEAELLAEKKQYQNEVQESRSREMELEEECGQYAKLLATSQRAVDEKVSEIARLDQQLRLSESEVEKKSGELHSAQVELEHEIAKTHRLTGDVDALKKQIVSCQSELSELKDADSRANAASKQVDTLRMEVTHLEAKVEDLQAQLDTAGPDQTAIYQEKMKALADRSEKQRATIQELTSSNTSLQVQIEQLRRQAKEEELLGSRASVTAMAQSAKYREAADEFGLRSRSLNVSQPVIPDVIEEKAPRVAEAARAIDQYSLATGSFLRTHPMARLGFAVYIIILHLWVFFVLMSAAHFHTPAPATAPHVTNAASSVMPGVPGTAARSI